MKRTDSPVTCNWLTRSRIEAIADFAERKQHDPTLPAEVREAMVEIRKQSRIAVAVLLGLEVEQRNREPVEVE